VAVAGLFWGRAVTIRDYVLKGKGLELQCETSSTIDSATRCAKYSIWYLSV